MNKRLVLFCESLAKTYGKEYKWRLNSNIAHIEIIDKHYKVVYSRTIDYIQGIIK